MIEPDFDMNGRIVGMSIVQPLSDVERDVIKHALVNWRSVPIVWTHNPPQVEITQLHGRVEPDIEDEP